MRQKRENAGFKRITAIGFAITLTIVGLTSVAQAATFTVTKTADTLDGICNSDCSLREAVYEANQSTDLFDIVVVPAGVFTLTITGDNEDGGFTGDLDLTGATLVTGAGPGITIIDASGLGDRVAHVLDNGVVTLRGFTITGGNVPSFGGGGVYNTGVLVLDNVDVTGNEGTAGGGVQTAHGGDLEIKNGSNISGNKGFHDGSVTGDGGGVEFSGGGDLTITDSTIADNIAQFGAGGLLIVASEATITRSTISGNRVTNPSGHGGGITISSGANVSLVNSTVEGNVAASGGGGIRVSDGQLHLHSVTISGNGQIVGGDIDSDGSVSFINTIIAGSCAGSGAFTNDGNSIESPANTCQLSQFVPDLLLSELGNFGGSTQTLLPLPGSPAINYALSYCLDTDQRGEHRNSQCTAGAVELLVSDPFFYGGFEGGDTSEWPFVVQ